MSVANQSYENLEIILVDDGSKDSCGKICETWKEKDSRIVVIHKENGGLSDARNAGIERATGRYITFVDSDDSVNEIFIEELYRLIVEYGADISTVGIHYVDEQGKSLSLGTRQEKDYVYDTHDALKELLKQKRISNSACGKLYDIRLFQDIGFPVGELYEDIATTYNLFLKSRVVAYNSSILYNYLVRAGSISNVKFSIKHMAALYHTDAMVQDIVNVYPDLDKYGKARRYMAALKIIQMVYPEKGHYKKEYNEAVSVINSTWVYAATTNNISKKVKILACFSWLPKNAWVKVFGRLLQ